MGLAFVLSLFVQVETDFDATSIFIVSDEVGDFMPWLILLAALGSQTSAIIGATMSRSDMIVDETPVKRDQVELLSEGGDFKVNR